MKNDYILLTPGPLSTSSRVREAMLKDWCTWDDEYNIGVVENIRQTLVQLATQKNHYSAVLMQGSGTASVEATIGSAVGPTDKLLVINNGVYGARIAQIADYLNIPCYNLSLPETTLPDLSEMNAILASEPDITHVAVVHCETTTGILNPIAEITALAKAYQKTVIVDAMSSFGGIPMDIGELDIDFMISSANKCIQGVPGFGFIIAKKEALKRCQGQARSLSLDLYEQWKCMEENHGKWRFTSPTHTVRAFYQALQELKQEGGINVRFMRYHTNQTMLVKGMRDLGFVPLLSDELHSPIITSFHAPSHPAFNFDLFYQQLKQQGFVIYPGKVSHADGFRIGNIGEIFPRDIERFLSAIKHAMYWEKCHEHTESSLISDHSPSF
ncbi:2-aminoethylphosphonate--pyruvate transaminase [Vibrio cincinnatiensis]|uniref:2-aminoethylphosphonate--pyruvate transaminase n=1 Tax=Vibrio cincinnatiensis TaxID=675 RepID=UPI001EE05A76|nr:2-aminoethylphosphonate--pyruvate transaminase [Vibrio cincinnatiensis]MCG3729147.1 2-aminoethylphosphonate--pyruvate transaminase [Vibrio cincinnatiensis]